MIIFLIISRIVLIFIILYTCSYKFYFFINSTYKRLFVIKNGSKALSDDTGLLNIRLIETLEINTDPDTFGSCDHIKYSIEQRERYFNWKFMGYGYRWRGVMASNNKENMTEMYQTIKSTLV